MDENYINCDINLDTISYNSLDVSIWFDELIHKVYSNSDIEGELILVKYDPHYKYEEWLLAEVDIIRKHDISTDTNVDNIDEEQHILNDINVIIDKYKDTRPINVIDAGFTKDQCILLLDSYEIMICGQPLDRNNHLENKETTVFKYVDSIPPIVSKISASEDNIFLVSDTGELYVYGSNKNQQLGIPELYGYINKFISVPYLNNVIDVVSTPNNTFIRTAGHDVYYCGKNIFEFNKYESIFVKIKGVENIKKIIVHDDCVVLLSYDNKIYYLGNSNIELNKQLYHGSIFNINTTTIKNEFRLLPQYICSNIKNIIIDSKDNLYVLYDSGEVYNYGNLFNNFVDSTPISLLYKNKTIKYIKQIFLNEYKNICFILCNNIVIDGDTECDIEKDVVKLVYDTQGENIIKILEDGSIKVKGNNKRNTLGIGYKKNVKYFIDNDINSELIKYKIIKKVLNE